MMDVCLTVTNITHVTVSVVKIIDTTSTDVQAELECSVLAGQSIMAG